MALADWLRDWQVPAVVMEATADYWKGPFYRLEAQGLEVRAGGCEAGQEPARAAEAGPVRLALAGGVLRARRGHRMLRGDAGVPADPRAHPLPADLTAERTREKQRAEKLLESAAIKICSVITDLHGMTGRDIMDRLIAGERDPKALAKLARGKARPKIARAGRGAGGRGVLHA